MPDPQPDLEFATSEEEAIDRAKTFKRQDPFPDIPRALLSSAEIEDYARVTAMLFPFSSEADALKDALKPASYEVRPGRKFVWWRENGERVDEPIREDGTYELPPNSIRYMQIEPRVRLPDYIAIRFNLRIKHVHRGLLLGTGPLIDPGFDGNILIPLHNLTSESYRIRGNEGLIWLEFTKTAAEVERANPPHRRRGQLRSMPSGKTDVSIDTYFQRANEGRPIRSSIPEAIRDAEARAEQAQTSAADAAKTASNMSTSVTRVGIGAIAGLILAVAALGVALHEYVAQVYSSFQQTADLASAVATNAVQAKTDASRALAEADAHERDLRMMRAEVEDLRSQLGTLTRRLGRLQPSGPAQALPSKQ